MTEQLVELMKIVDNPYQPRTTDDPEHVEKLARSIAADGLLQAPKARKASQNGSFELAFGHSRRKAFEWLLANWKEQDLPDRYNGYGCMPVEILDLSDEEMYRYAVTENVQRKDLAPTEVARSLKRYMDEFGTSSKKAADLFGMNDATVRGMVRLLELPEPVQAKLDDGTITQGTARTLLSIQKIAPQDKLLEITSRIEKQKGKTLPEEVIEDVVEHLENTIDMWDTRYRSGKPLAGYDGWPLDMKRFPNDLLQPLTYKDVIEAIGANEDPELGVLVKENLSFFDLQKKLQEMNHPAALLIEHLLHPTACNACPYFTKVRGSHICGVKICYQRKKAAWAVHLIQSASKKLEIPIYQKSDGAFRVLSGWQHEKIFTSRDKGLRLIPTSQVNGNCYQHFEGVNDDVFVVVATGSTINKLGKDGSGGRGQGPKTDEEKLEMRRMKLYRRYRKELLWEFTGAAKAVFDGVPFAAMDHVQSWKFLGVDAQPPEEEPGEDASDDARTDYLRRKTIWKMIEEHSSHYRREDLADILEDLDELAGTWGIKVPAAIKKRVQEWDEEIKSVSVETAATKKAKK